MHVTRVLVPLLFAAACTNTLEPPSATIHQDALAVSKVLQNVNVHFFEEAFAAGLTRPHVRHLMAQQRNRRTMRMKQEVFRVADGGALSQLFSQGELSEEPDAGNIARLPSRIMPEAPAFMSARFRDEFSFRFLPDTLHWERPVQVIEVAARTSSRQTIRHVRYFLDRATGLLVDYQLSLQSSQILYSEDSRYRLSLRPGPEDEWLPHQVGIEVVMHLPPARTRMITREITFSDYDS